MAHRPAPTRGGQKSKSARDQKPRKRRKPKAISGQPEGRHLLYGRHAVEAALANPARVVHALYASQKDATDLAALRPGVSVLDFTDGIARALPPGAVHQRVAIAADPLEQPALPALLGHNPPDMLVMLDQVTDPHNVGAVFRSAAAFGAGGLIMQARHAPEETATLARAASGTLEQVPWVSVTNLNRALEEIAQAQYWTVGLDGAANDDLEDVVAGHQKLCLVFGAEGPGLRQNVKAHCDALARLAIKRSVESLNVSNAAAVALYIASKRAG
ncbi:MAG: RNA methyltransferase [Pseudomonadota bacterium]